MGSTIQTAAPASADAVWHVGAVVVDRYGAFYHVDAVELCDSYDHLNVFLRRWKDGQWQAPPQRCRCASTDWSPYAYAGDDVDPAAFAADALAVAFDGDPTSLDPWQGTTLPAATTHSVGAVRALQAQIDAQMQRVEAIRRVAARRVDQLANVTGELRQYLAKTQRVIGALELYLGHGTEIVQVRTGAPAPVATPITLYQQVLYMDEETGDPRLRNGQPGIDFRSVEDFDRWLLEADHLEQVLPNARGVRALRPSRQHRIYSNNAWENTFIQANNDYVYLLVRNGDHVARVWTNTTQMGRRLFPSPSEVATVWEQAQEDGWTSSLEHAHDVEFAYKRNVLLLQGLLDHTDLLKPLPRAVNLFDELAVRDEPSRLVGLVFDDEASLHDGRRPYYHDWRAAINAQIGVGSRIVVAITSPYHQLGSDTRSRFVRYYAHQQSTPSAPKPGVYQVEDVLPPRSTVWEPRERFVIRYNPGDIVYSGWDDFQGHTRKNRVSFIVYRTDPFVLNFDQIVLSDVEYYIASRIERERYLEMIPTLWTMRDWLLDEREHERHLVRLVACRVGCSEEEVWEGIDWWKHKNKWKRAVHDDDAKALRMIEQRLQRDPA
jgi:hypothetical protein